MKQNSVAIVGAAETTDLGKIPNLSQIGLHADAALNALRKIRARAGNYMHPDPAKQLQRLRDIASSALERMG